MTHVPSPTYAALYPNMAIFDVHSTEVAAIRDFFDWLDNGRPTINGDRRGQRYFLAHHARREDGSTRDDPSAVLESMERLIHQWLGVDTEALERERRAYLASISGAPT